MKKPVRIPGTSWMVDILANEVPESYSVKFIKGSHPHYKYIIEKDGSLEEIFEIFRDAEKISLPRNRLDNILSKLDEELFNLEAKKSVERKSTESWIQSLSMDKKILILGLAGAGKTSIYEVIFEGKKWWDLEDIYPTHGIQRYKQGTRLFVWDLGGQNTYIEEYHKKASEIFPQTTVLIYVIDASDPEKLEKCRDELGWALEQIKEYSPKSLLFCFIHKMDKFSNSDETYNGVKNFLKEEIKNSSIEYISTSIKKDSVYKAMQLLFKSIIPKSKKLNLLAENLKKEIGLYNVVVLEKRTGLPICASSTLFDDIVLIGTINKIWDGTAKLTNDLELVTMDKITVRCGNGYLSAQEFEENIILLLISPDLKSIESAKSQQHVDKFKIEMKNYI
ncbi:MAG: ADP-ribosylation factor-like protein [Promethearchaeota archaeon]